MNGGTVWKILIVEDKETVAKQLEEQVPLFFDAPDIGEVDLYRSFKEAAEILKYQKYDFLILDLKDDSTEASQPEEHAGIAIFETLKKTRFTPVIFYTALPQLVRGEETSFVRVVEKTESITKIKEEIKKVLATKLPQLCRKLEETQRSYMWEFIGSHWKELRESHDQADIAYLLARRMALTFETQAKELADDVSGMKDMSGRRKVHPMIMYINPPVHSHRLAGDILKTSDDKGVATYWLVLTPSCDFAQSKVDHVLLAKCDPMLDQKEYKSWSANTATPSKTVKIELHQLMTDKRKNQPERFKYLPGTFFLPDLVVDFQQLRSVAVAEVASFEAIAALDSPFAEAVLARFSRYFGRLGTPDVDENIVETRLMAKMQIPPQPTPATSPA